MSKVLIRKNLNRWFKEKWVDVSRKDKDGKHPPCGRSKAKKGSKGYPKCRPSVKVSSKTPRTSGSMTEGEKRAATKRKRAKKQGVGGKPTIVKGVMVKAPRIPRKKGQPANSKKHSDLYTDENPKGTIHGLGFKNPAKARQSVVKIKNSNKSHAHKTQAAIAMEQRAREMGKTKEANVYRKFIEVQKRKTKEMKKALPLTEYDVSGLPDFSTTIKNEPMYAATLAQHALNRAKQKRIPATQAVQDAYLDLERGKSSILARYTPEFYAQFVAAVSQALENNSDTVYLGREHQSALEGYIKEMGELSDSWNESSKNLLQGSSKPDDDTISSVHDLPTKFVVNHYLNRHLNEAHEFRMQSRAGRSRSERDKLMPLTMFGLPSDMPTLPAIESNRQRYGRDKPSKPLQPTHVRQLINEEGRPYQHILMSGDEPLASIKGTPNSNNRIHIGFGQGRPDLRGKGYYPMLVNALVQAGYSVHSDNRNYEYSHPSHLAMQGRFPRNVTFAAGDYMGDKYSRNYRGGSDADFEYKRMPNVSQLEQMLGRPLTEQEFVDNFKNYGAFPIERLTTGGELSYALQSGKEARENFERELADRRRRAEKDSKIPYPTRRQLRFDRMSIPYYMGLTGYGENYDYPFQPFDFEEQERQMAAPADEERIRRILENMPNREGKVRVIRPPPEPPLFEGALDSVDELYNRVKKVSLHLHNAFGEHDLEESRTVLDTNYPIHNRLASMHRRYEDGDDVLTVSPFRLDKLKDHITDIIGLPALTSAETANMSQQAEERYNAQRGIVSKLILEAFQGVGPFRRIAVAGDHSSDDNRMDNQDRRNFESSLGHTTAFKDAYKERMERLGYTPDEIQNIGIQPEIDPAEIQDQIARQTLQDKGFKVAPPKNLVGVQQRATPETMRERMERIRRERQQRGATTRLHRDEHGRITAVPLPNPTDHGLPEWFNQDHIFGLDRIETLANADNPVTVDWGGTPTRIDDKELSEHLETGEGYLVKHPHKNEYKVLYWENLAEYDRERARLVAEHRRQEGQDEINEMTQRQSPQLGQFIGITHPRYPNTAQAILAGTDHIPNFSLANSVDMDAIDFYNRNTPDLMVDWYGTPTKISDERLQEHLTSGDAMLHQQPRDVGIPDDGHEFHVVHNDQIAQQQMNNPN